MMDDHNDSVNDIEMFRDILGAEYNVPIEIADTLSQLPTRKRIVTVLRLIEAQLTGGSMEETFKLKEVCSKKTWHGPYTNGVQQPGWRDDPLVRKAMAIVGTWAGAHYVGTILQRIDNIKPEYTQLESKGGGCVYIIGNNAGCYKIGKTTNLKNRLANLNTSSPYPLDVVHAIPTPNINNCENILHAIFAEKRVNGEWFRLSDEDVEWLKQQQTGILMQAMLPSLEDNRDELSP